MRRYRFVRTDVWGGGGNPFWARVLATAAVAVLAACAGLIAFGGSAQAQTVAPIPKLSTSPDIPNGFYVEVVDENNPQNAVPYNTFDGASGTSMSVLTITAPAGAKILFDHASRVWWCNVDGSNPCNVAWYLMRQRSGFDSFQAATAPVRKELVRFLPPPGQTKMTVTVSLVRDSDGATKSQSIEVEYRDTLEPELRYVRDYRFVRVNGATDPLQRDRMLFRLAIKGSHWDDRWLTKAVMRAPEGSYIFSKAFDSGCAEARELTDDAPGHECELGTGVTRALDPDRRNGDIDHVTNVFYFSPPESGSGTAQLELEMTTVTGSTRTATLDIGYGPDVPAGLSKPYPVAELRDGPLRLIRPPFGNARLKNGVPIYHELIVRDARDNRPASVSATSPDFWEMADTWFNPEWTPRLRSGRAGLVPYSLDPPIAQGEYVQGYIYAADNMARCNAPDAPLEWSRWLGSIAPCAHTLRQRTPNTGSGKLVGETVVWAEYVPFTALRPLITTAIYGPIEYGVSAYLDATGSAADPVAAVDLPDDADQIVGPGDEIAVRASLSATVTPPSDRDVVTACIHTNEAAAPPAATYLADPLPYCAYNDLLDGTQSYLVITGPATWQDTGGKRLAIGAGSGYPVFHCRGLDEDLTVVCDVKSLAGEYPALAVASDASGDEIAISAKFVSHELAGRGGFHVAWGEVGADWGSHAALADRPDEVFGRSTFSLDGIKQVHEAALERESVGPALAGTREALLLRIRNERGAPAAASAISSITVVAAGGGEIDSDWCSAGAACTFNMAALRESAEGANRGPQLIGAIPLSLRLPDGTGTVEVTATIVAPLGTLRANLALEVLGPAASLDLGGSLELSRRLPIVHHHATPDDDRDIAIISARAFDSSRQETTLPAGAVREILDPSGNTLAPGRATVAELCAGSRTACSYRVQVTASRDDPLDLGRYSLRVSAAGVSASAGFIVVGPAAGIEVIEAEPQGLMQMFDFRVRVTDDHGNPVADGTAVWWDAITRNPPDGPRTAAMVAITPLVEPYTKTRGGEALAEIMTIGEEIGILFAHAGGLREDPDVSMLVVVDTGLPDDCTARRLSEITADTAMGIAFASFNGRLSCRASELYASLAPDWSALHLWNGMEWMSYAEADGAPVPGTSDYAIAPGDTLRLIAAPAPDQ